jgi:hypothetical protein
MRIGICFQMPPTFSIDRRTTTYSYWMYMVHEIAIAKLKRYKLPGSDQILAELIPTGGEIRRSEINILINSIWNKEEPPDQWKEYIIVPVHRKGAKTDCSNHPGISLLSSSYKIVVNILSRLSP